MAAVIKRIHECQAGMRQIRRDRVSDEELTANQAKASEARARVLAELKACERTCIALGLGSYLRYKPRTASYKTIDAQRITEAFARMKQQPEFLAAAALQLVEKSQKKRKADLMQEDDVTYGTVLTAALTTSITESIRSFRESWEVAKSCEKVPKGAPSSVRDAMSEPMRAALSTAYADYKEARFILTKRHAFYNEAMEKLAVELELLQDELQAEQAIANIEQRERRTFVDPMYENTVFTVERKVKRQAIKITISNFFQFVANTKLYFTNQQALDQKLNVTTLDDKKALQATLGALLTDDFLAKLESDMLAEFKEHYMEEETLYAGMDVRDDDDSDM